MIPEYWWEEKEENDAVDTFSYQWRTKAKEWAYEKEVGRGAGRQKNIKIME